MGTQPFAVSGIEDHFHKTFLAAGSAGFPGGGKRELAHFDLVTGILSLFLGHSHGCHFRHGVGT